VNALAAEVEEQIDALLSAQPFALAPKEHQARLLRVLQCELSYAAERNPRLRQYLEAWPIDYRAAESIADLPYLPVGAFKADPPLARKNHPHARLERHHRADTEPRGAGCTDFPTHGERRRRDRQ